MCRIQVVCTSLKCNMVLTNISGDVRRYDDIIVICSLAKIGFSHVQLKILIETGPKALLKQTVNLLYDI